MKKIVALLLISALLSGCIFEISNENNNPPNQDNLYQITNIIEGIFIAYNSQNIYAVMDFYDSYFLHNGIDYFGEENIWEDRFGRNAKVSNISIVWINANNAEISFTLILNNTTYYVPADGFEDVTYLRKINGVWKVYGNQKLSEEHYYITINTNPSGANIYLNGQNLHRSTPATLEDISSGTYTIGVYLFGYNEVTQSVFLDEDKNILITLQIPLNPPCITVTSPDNEETIYEAQFYLSGYIQNFSGEKAILNLNGNEQDIEVCLGDFHQYITVTEPENEFFLRATNTEGDTGVSAIYHIYRSDQMYDIRIELTWDTDSTDVDLHIWDPDSNHCYYGDKYAIPNGYLERDDTDGYGPEIFTQSPVSDGTYIVKAHFFDGYSGENPTSAWAEITFNGDTTSFGPYEFTADGDDEDAWWDVCSFEITNGKFSKSENTNYNFCIDRNTITEK